MLQHISRHTDSTVQNTSSRAGRRTVRRPFSRPGQLIPRSGIMPDHHADQWPKRHPPPCPVISNRLPLSSSSAFSPRRAFSLPFTVAGSLSIRDCRHTVHDGQDWRAHGSPEAMFFWSFSRLRSESFLKNLQPSFAPTAEKHNARRFKIGVDECERGFRQVFRSMSRLKTPEININSSPSLPD